MSAVPSGKSTNVESNSTSVESQASFAEKMAERVRARASELNLNASSFGTAVGIKSSALSNYWNGKRPFPTEVLPRMSEVLSTSVDFLLSGRRPVSAVMADANDADWEQLPFFDLREVNDTGMGEAKGWTPVRKDWLNLTFGRSKGLWLTKLLSEYAPLDFQEGEQVICCDISKEDLRERYLCVWRVLPLDQIVVGRYSVLHRGNQIAVQEEGEYWMNPQLIQGDLEHGIGADVVPIGRILGRFLQRI